MKVLVAANRADETEIFQKVNKKYQFELVFQAEQLTLEQVHELEGFDAICINAGCKVTEEFAAGLKEKGIQYILTRAAGKDHLDLNAIQKYGLKSANVPAYSPSAISEHTVMMILAVLRKLKMQMRKIEEQYYFINGLRGRELRSMTVGVMGTGRIGTKTIQNLTGFGCKILAYDPFENDYVKEHAEYVTKETLLRESDIVVLHCPMIPENYHMIDRKALDSMKDGAVLINTARGALVDTKSVYQALVNGKLSGFGMDVYEYEDRTQRKDYRGKELDDELLKKLLELDNVLFTSHTAFYTDEAVENIIDTSLTNLYEWATTGNCQNETK